MSKKRPIVDEGPKPGPAHGMVRGEAWVGLKRVKTRGLTLREETEPEDLRELLSSLDSAARTPIERFRAAKARAEKYPTVTALQYEIGWLDVMVGAPGTKLAVYFALLAVERLLDLLDTEQHRQAVEHHANRKAGHERNPGGRPRKDVIVDKVCDRTVKRASKREREQKS